MIFIEDTYDFPERGQPMGHGKNRWSLAVNISKDFFMKSAFFMIRKGVKRSGRMEKQSIKRDRPFGILYHNTFF
jgi:hypothetical protein